MFGHRLESRNVPFIDVLWAGITDDIFELSYLGHKKWLKGRELVTLEGRVQSVKPGTAEEWCAEAMDLAYKGFCSNQIIYFKILMHNKM